MSIFAPILSLCLLLVVLLPLLSRPRPGKVFSVSVTALNSPSVRSPEANARAAGAQQQLQNGPTAPVPASGAYAEAITVEFPALGAFASSLLNGNAEDVVGVYVDGLMALPVRQQPQGRPDFVSEDDNMLTQFSLPRQYGAVGLLAHNFLSGRNFPMLVEGTEIVVVYGGGQLRRFVVTGRESFQALTPTSPFSQFADPDQPGVVLSSAELFKRMYTRENTLVFQTCIEAYGDPSWGRMFITAEPVEEIQLTIPALETIYDLN